MAAAPSAALLPPAVERAPSDLAGYEVGQRIAAARLEAGVLSATTPLALPIDTFSSRCTEGGLPIGAHLDAPRPAHTVRPLPAPCLTPSVDVAGASRQEVAAAVRERRRIVMQGTSALTCLMVAAVSECSANGTLSNARYVTDTFLAATPTALPGVQVTIGAASTAAGEPVALIDGALPATAQAGAVCTNVLQSVQWTVFMTGDGAVGSVLADVVVTNVTSDAAFGVAVRQAFAVTFRVLGAEVRPMCTQTHA